MEMQRDKNSQHTCGRKHSVVEGMAPLIIKLYFTSHSLTSWGVGPRVTDRLVGNSIKEGGERAIFSLNGVVSDAWLHGKKPYTRYNNCRSITDLNVKAEISNLLEHHIVEYFHNLMVGKDFLYTGYIKLTRLVGWSLQFEFILDCWLLLLSENISENG